MQTKYKHNMLYILPLNVCASNFLFNKSNTILPSKGSKRNGCLGIDADMVSPPKALGRIEGIILDTVLAPRTSTIAISQHLKKKIEVGQ